LPGVLPQTRLKAGRKKVKLSLSTELQELNAPIIDKRLSVLADVLGVQPVVRLQQSDADDGGGV
jgi:hypothetical protein